MLELLAAAAEDERIAALEPHHVAALAGRLDQARVDLVLADAGLAARLPTNTALGVAARAIEDLRLTSSS